MWGYLWTSVVELEGSLIILNSAAMASVMGSYENPKVDTRQKTSCTKSSETHKQKLVVQTSVFKIFFSSPAWDTQLHNDLLIETIWVVP